MLDINALPTDVTQLQRLLIEHHELVATQSVDLRTKQRQIEHLKFQLAQLRRFRFGQSSERLEGIEQMILSLEELKASVVQASPTPDAAVPDKGQPARRKHLPEHFERIDNTIEPNECTCPDCGGPLGLLGTDTAEVLEVKTVSFTVTRHIRPKRRCSSCAVIVQAPAPSRPIEKSFAGASLLALILSWKYAFHLPLYRQCQIFAHAGLTLSRTTLMQWVGASSELLGPLVAALAKHVLSAPNINADDTPIKVLAPGAGKTKRGHLWTYVRDGRPWGSTDPPAVWYRYSPSWHGKYPQKHLAGFMASCRWTRTRASSHFLWRLNPMWPRASWRSLALRTCAASGSTCTRPINLRLPKRLLSASANCMASRRRSAVNRPRIVWRSANGTPRRCSPHYTPG